MIRVYPHIIDCMCFFTVKFCQHPVVNSNQQMSEDGQETRGGRGILGRRREGNRQKMPLDTDGASVECGTQFPVMRREIFYQNYAA